jgi:hypothetical protein
LLQFFYTLFSPKTPRYFSKENEVKGIYCACVSTTFPAEPGGNSISLFAATYASISTSSLVAKSYTPSCYRTFPLEMKKKMEVLCGCFLAVFIFIFCHDEQPRQPYVSLQIAILFCHVSRVFRTETYG